MVASLVTLHKKIMYPIYRGCKLNLKGIVNIFLLSNLMKVVATHDQVYQRCKKINSFQIRGRYCVSNIFKRYQPNKVEFNA